LRQLLQAGNRLVPNFLLAVLVGVAAASMLAAAEGIRDPEFDKVPFDQWFTGADQAQLKWTEHTLPVLLSVHQRLMARMQVQLDGAEAAKRKGEGQLLFFFQITDSNGRIYQDHTPYDLAKVEDGMRAQDLSITESAFMLPGDYSVSIAIYDTATREHSTKKIKLHIAPLKLDPLPDAWRNLPPVEFVDTSDSPDHWFLPKEKGKLNLPLALPRPARIDVLLNLTPTEEHARNFGIQDRNLSVMVPALKVISQMTGPGLGITASLVDISRRRVIYHQDELHEVDWEKLKASLPQSNSGSIDVKSLADRKHNAAFLGSEIERKFRSGDSGAGQGHVVIVLSGPMVFETGQEFEHPLAKPCANCRVYYIRIQMPAARVVVPETGRRRGFGSYPGRMRTPPEDEITFTTEMDQLAPLMKPLDPRIFDVATAEQFRKALASIMNDMSGL
jgi:hypothetical protein